MVTKYDNIDPHNVAKYSRSCLYAIRFKTLIRANNVAS